LFGRNLELRRTISSRLGENAIDITDEFTNVGNETVPHAWLAHINFGYPLIQEGTEFCYDSPKVEPVPTDESRKMFKKGAPYKVAPAPLESHRGANEAAAYLFPRAGKNGSATVGVVNRKLNLGVAVRYNTREFPRCLNWQHWGPGEYVTALEPVNGTVQGRAKDREQGLLDEIRAGATKTYRYRIETVSTPEGINALRALNR
jgi:hypothetical protein